MRPRITWDRIAGTIRPRRGATVPEVGAERVCEMFEVMAELEAMCGRLAARRITPGEQLALQEAHRACEAARDEVEAALRG